MTPNKRILRLPQVQDKTGYKHTAIYEMVKAGSFPAPISLGARAVGWIESEIDEWIDRRIEASRNNAGPTMHPPKNEIAG